MLLSLEAKPCVASPLETSCLPSAFGRSAVRRFAPLPVGEKNRTVTRIARGVVGSAVTRSHELQMIDDDQAKVMLALRPCRCRLVLAPLLGACASCRTRRRSGHSRGLGPIPLGRGANAAPRRRGFLGSIRRRRRRASGASARNVATEPTEKSHTASIPCNRLWQRDLHKPPNNEHQRGEIEDVRNFFSGHSEARSRGHSFTLRASKKYV